MERKKKNKFIITLVTIFSIIFIIAIICIFLFFSNVLNQKYTGDETNEKVTNSKLTDEEKKLYNEAIKRNDNSLLLEKTVKEIIEEERERQIQEQKEIEKQKIKQEQINEMEEKISTNLYQKINDNFGGYMDEIEIATYTYRINDIDFKKLRKYYNNTKEAVEIFKTEISAIEGLEEKNKTNFNNLDRYLDAFDKATQKKSDINEFFDAFDKLGDEFKICVKELFKNISGGKDISEYLN